MLRSLDWYLVPLVNPDGYEFSQTKDRFWRKNRRPPGPAEKCHGVDLNRNFHLGYGLGASRDSCSEVFQGPGPGSEPETAALMSLGARLNTSLLYYVSLHAYGQSWLTPWGFTTDPPSNLEELQARVLHLDVEEWSEELLTPALLCHKEPARASKAPY